jgi:PAS domain S-box-containing protein
MVTDPAKMDEARRLEALRRYAVLDTEPEADFDDLVRLATQICDVPMALISLVDECRQWFKAAVGITIPETPREISFCTHALQQRALLIVPDTMQDKRFRHSPLVTGDLGIRFYAGAPLVNADGAVLGTLCVMDRVPRTLTAAQEETLRVLARQVMAQFELRHRENEQRRAVAALALSEKAFSDMMIESMPGVLYFYDDQGRFLRWNRTFEKVTGYTGEEIARMHPRDFFAPENRPALEERIAEVFVQGESWLEAPFVAKDGRSTPYYITGRRVEFRGQTCLVGVGIDITQRKEAERALRELNETLERKVAERTAELQAALVHAESADRLKSAFLATMSHELRTPMNSIIGFTSTVLQGFAGPVNDEQKKQLGMVRASGRHLLELINDVLDLSKIEAGQFQVRAEPFDLRAALERTAATVQPLAEKKNLAVRVRIAPGIGEMASDQRRAGQIVLNLLNNAIKFTERGHVSLEAELVPDFRGKPAVRLVVGDTGIGIKPEDLPTLFQPFRQVDTSLARMHEGTGLGLAICRRLATLLGGEISVASEWQRGSEFTAILPLQMPAPS